MSIAELKSRLETAQLALCEALDNDRPEEMPKLIAAREADLRALVAELDGDAELKVWAKSYLQADQKLLARAAAARDAVMEKMQDVSNKRSIHRLYISEGMRR